LNLPIAHSPREAAIEQAERLYQEMIQRLLGQLTTRPGWLLTDSAVNLEKDQGFKIHLSATPQTATNLVCAISSYLNERKLAVKLCSSLTTLKRLNIGLFGSFSQVGKFLTIYIEDDINLLEILQDLACLTNGISGPTVPYDCHYKGIVHFRYGSFKSKFINRPDGKRVLDSRSPGHALPSWIPNPVVRLRKKRNRHTNLSCYPAFESLSQRGKGGVYKAVNLKDGGGLCVLKEGRRHGEVDFFGGDACERLRNEARILRTLHSHGVSVPLVIDIIASCNNYYLIMDFISDRSMLNWLSTRSFGITERLQMCLKLSILTSAIHECGVAWRDLKPTNLLLNKDNILYAIDFEGASANGCKVPYAWGSPGYCPPDWLTQAKHSDYFSHDLYSLGVTMRQICNGCASPLKKRGLPNKTPKAFRNIILRLEDPCPHIRPTANTVIETLAECIG
jgi:hypothetical protein